MDREEFKDAAKVEAILQTHKLQMRSEEEQGSGESLIKLETLGERIEM